MKFSKKPFTIKLKDSQELKLSWDELDQKWVGHISYWDNMDKLNDHVLGVNAIANAVASGAKNHHYVLSLNNLILTISIYDF